MKKKNTLTLVLSSAMLVGALVGCSSKSKKTSGTNGDDDNSTREGFTSLANKNANAALDADGNYTYAGKTFKTKNVYKSYYTAEVATAKFDYLINDKQQNSRFYCNLVDGLVENDKYGNIVGAIAKGYKVTENEDGTETWTFDLRKNATWVTNADGTKVADVTANDFVSGLEYALDPLVGCGTIGIITMFINNSSEYYEYKNYEEMSEADKQAYVTKYGAAPDKVTFDQVGVKAVDDYTLEYTIYQSAPYFLSALTYSPFLPVYGEYLDEVGTDWGASENNILVNGAFRITQHTAESKVVYTKNESYYDKDHVYVDTVDLTYLGGTATASQTREWFEAGSIDGFSVSAKDTVGYKKYVTGEDGTGTVQNPYSTQCNGILSVGDATYGGQWNFNRTSWKYTDTAMIKTDAQKEASATAVLNKNFRLGFLYSMDVLAELEYYNPTEPYQYLARAYTNRELCYADGKDYVDYVTDVFNEKQGTTGVSLTGITNKADPVYSQEKGKKYFEDAKKELLAAGLTESDFPIKIDCVGDRSVEFQPYEKAMIDTINEAGEGIVEVSLNVPSSDDETNSWIWDECNYDFSFSTGWGPDYADPNTYLHTMAVNGDNMWYSGLESDLSESTVAALANLGKSDITTPAQLQEYVLGAYNEKYLAGAEIVDPNKLVERYEKFAEAEYALIYEEGLYVPFLQANAYVPSVSKTVPHQAGKASYGLTADKFKNVIVTENIIDRETRTAIDSYYDSNK